MRTSQSSRTLGSGRPAVQEPGEQVTLLRLLLGLGDGRQDGVEEDLAGRLVNASSPHVPTPCQLQKVRVHHLRIPFIHMTISILYDIAFFYQ